MKVYMVIAYCYIGEATVDSLWFKKSDAKDRRDEKNEGKRPDDIWEVKKMKVQKTS